VCRGVEICVSTVSTHLACVCGDPGKAIVPQLCRNDILPHIRDSSPPVRRGKGYSPGCPVGMTRISFETWYVSRTVQASILLSPGNVERKRCYEKDIYARLLYVHYGRTAYLRVYLCLWAGRLWQASSGMSQTFRCNFRSSRLPLQTPF